MVETVVCLADVGVCPGCYPGAGCGVFGEGFFVHPGSVDGGEVVELCAPLCGLVECGDAGEVQGELVDRAFGVGAWSAGGVSAYHALGVDEAALDAGGWPAFFDGAVGSLSAVDDGGQWWADAFEEALVVEGGFVCAPVPGDDVVDGGGDDQAAGGGVGAVEENLVVDASGVSGGGVWGVDEPEGGESALQCSWGASGVVGDGGQAGAGGAVVDELGEGCGVGDVGAVFGAGGAALFTAPSGGAFGGGSVAFHVAAAVAAWSVFGHWITTSRPLSPFVLVVGDFRGEGWIYDCRAYIFVVCAVQVLEINVSGHTFWSLDLNIC